MQNPILGIACLLKAMWSPSSHSTSQFSALPTLFTLLPIFQGFCQFHCLFATFFFPMSQQRAQPILRRLSHLLRSDAWLLCPRNSITQIPPYPRHSTLPLWSAASWDKMYCLAVSCRASNLRPWENAGSLPAVLPIPGTRLISQRTQQPAAKFIALPRLFFLYCTFSGKMPTPPILQKVEADLISGILSSHAHYHPLPLHSGEWASCYWAWHPCPLEAGLGSLHSWGRQAVPSHLWIFILSSDFEQTSLFTRCLYLTLPLKCAIQ